ncbi:MAG: spondin domain-containing protein [Gaiellaceae bacterium]
MKRLVLGVLALACAAALVVPAAGSERRTHTWSVTVANLTPAGSQPLSPPLVVVHSKRADVWSLGQIANHGVAAIAEDANNAVLESALPGLRGIRSVQTVPGGPIMPGTSRTFTIRSNGNADRLSILTMLVNTNDALTGLDSLHLRGRGDTVATRAYDGGSEVNNERATHIPGPCCNNPFVRDPEGAVIRMHGGIKGVGDLSPAVYGWSDPVARIRIARG